MFGFAELIESQARGSRDFHRFLHHRLRRPPAVVEDPNGHPTVSPDLLGEGVVHVAVLRALLRRAAGAAEAPPVPRARPEGDPGGWSFAEHCGAVALALENGRSRRWLGRPGEASDLEIAGRLNRSAARAGAPRFRRAREEMAWHKALAAQWFSGRLDEGCDLCDGATAASGWVVSDIPGAWR